MSESNYEEQEKSFVKKKKIDKKTSSDIDILDLDDFFIDKMKNLCYHRKYSNYEELEFEKYEGLIWVSDSIKDENNIPIVICVIKNANGKVMSSSQFSYLQKYRADFQTSKQLGQPAKTIVCYFDGIYHESYKVFMRNRNYFDLIPAQVVYVNPYDSIDSAIEIKKLDQEEKDNLFAELNISPSVGLNKSLKVLYSDRYISQYFGFKSGDIIKILLRSWATTVRPITLVDGSTRFINYFNTEVDYRIVKNPSVEEVERHKDYVRSSRFDTLNNRDKREIKLVSIEEE